MAIVVVTDRGDRPRVGISQCLLGDEVRYDGGHKRDEPLLAVFGADVEWVPVCPEVEVGMGTPREPIQLVAAADGVQAGAARVRLMGVSSGRDWTAAMAAWAAARACELARLGLSGFIVKAGSPSCGVRDVRVHPSAVAGGRGLFAQALADAMPDLPVEDESRLADARVRDEFRARVFARHRARQAHERA